MEAVKLTGIAKFARIFRHPVAPRPEHVEIYRHWQALSLTAEDWHMALLIFREMGWQPLRPFDSYLYPLSFVTPDEAVLMAEAGRTLFQAIEREPALSASVQMDLGLFHEILLFISKDSFIIGRPGDMERASFETP